jgi:hypothetical protein
MKWMIFVSVFIAVSLVPTYAQLPPMAPLSGTCASIGLSDTCCPLSSSRANCRASDGNCYCSADCHLFNYDDCCSDVACPSSKYAIEFLFIICNDSCNINFSLNLLLHSADPTMCAHIGIVGCCNSTLLGACRVGNGLGSCACDILCHNRGDCCPDVCPRKLNFTVIHAVHIVS